MKLKPKADAIRVFKPNYYLASRKFVQVDWDIKFRKITQEQGRYLLSIKLEGYQELINFRNVTNTFLLVF